MIDYKKLKMAHELCEKYAKYNYPRMISLNINHRYNALDYYNAYLEIIEDFKILFEWNFNSIDELIAKLRELTQSEEPKANYSVGDEVWIAYSKGFYSRKIEEVILHEDGRYSYHGDGFGLYDDELYPTKQTLIAAQIEYWQKIKDEL